jgi:hypothetical protein
MADLSTPIGGLGLSTRVVNALTAAGFSTLADIVSHTQAELSRFTNIGARAVDEIKEMLVSQGLRLGMDPPPSAQMLPHGEYAIVEIMGHRTIIGRVEEVERFGSKLMSIEPVFQSQLLPAVLLGGGSIYQFTPCSPTVALKRQPTQVYQLPPSVGATLPPEMLPAPSRGREHDEEPF